MLRILPFSFGLLLALLGCTHDSVEALRPTEPTPTAAVSFAEEVRPLMQAYCSLSGCHDGSSPLADPLLTYAQIRPQAQAIADEVASGSMPIGRSLRADQIDLLLRWVAEGAREN